MRSMLIVLVVLLGFSSTAAVAQFGAPQLVIDPAAIAEAVRHIRETEKVIRGIGQSNVWLDKIEKWEEDIWESQTGVRASFAGMVNGGNQRFNQRRYMPSDWDCAMTVMSTGCDVGSHQNDWLLQVAELTARYNLVQPDQMAQIYGSGPMSPTQATYLRNVQGGTMASMASSHTLQGQMEDRHYNVEYLIDRLQSGPTEDVQGQMALNNRLVGEVALSLQTLTRLTAQLLYMQAMEQQGEVSARHTRAQMMGAWRNPIPVSNPEFPFGEVE